MVAELVSKNGVGDVECQRKPWHDVADTVIVDWHIVLRLRERCIHRTVVFTISRNWRGERCSQDGWRVTRRWASDEPMQTSQVGWHLPQSQFVVIGRAQRDMDERRVDA